MVTAMNERREGKIGGLGGEGLGENSEREFEREFEREDVREKKMVSHHVNRDN